MTDQSQVRSRFVYGRHETFPVRHGWLAKGLQRIRETGAFRGDLATADALGLGSRMRSSRCSSGWRRVDWRRACSPRPAADRTDDGGLKEWRITDFGEAASRYDPYFEFPVTWWFLHLALAQREGSVWGWFFNDFPERYFSREASISAFRDHATRHSANPPSLAIAQREIACLLQAYSVQQASALQDPEDSTACPLRELGLVVRHGEGDRFEKTQPIDRVPVEAFLACAATLAAHEGSDSVTFTDLMRSRLGPRRILGLGIDQVESTAELATDLYADRGVQVTMLGSERILVLPDASFSMWLAAHFRRIGWNAR